LNHYEAGRELRAFYDLLHPQRHNADALAYYRATWRDQKVKIIEMIKGLIGP
jgi:hypothetical protein